MGIQERKQRERERRRQQIIVAAKRVFSERGFSKTTMEDIAREAELSPGTLYLYFKNKDELYASLSLRILQYMNIRIEDVKKEKDSEPDLSHIIASIKEALYDVYQFDPMILINMFHLQSSETLKNISSPLLDNISELSRNSLQALADIFKESSDRNTVLTRQPTAVADIVWSLFTGVVLWEESKRMIDDDKDYLKHTLDIAFEILARGISE
jgi:AcrR family transcriptional regulator